MFVSLTVRGKYSSSTTAKENMLVCAPTGAGKTNIAMLAFLRLVKSHMMAAGDADVIDKAALKVPLPSLLTQSP